MPIGARVGKSYRALPELLTLAPCQRMDCEQVWMPRLVDCAVVVLTASHDPVLGIVVSPTTVVAGQEVDVTARVVNPSPKAVKLQLEVDGSPGIAAGEKATVTCPAGGMVDVDGLKTKLIREAQPGYETLQVAATMPDGKRLFSPSAEIEVLPDVTLEIAGASQTLWPRVDNPSRIVVRALNRRAV
jgi:hypothetical protein